MIIRHSVSQWLNFTGRLTVSQGNPMTFEQFEIITILSGLLLGGSLLCILYAALVWVVEKLT